MRPYLLTKFRSRKNKEQKKISKENFKSLISDIRAYIKGSERNFNLKKPYPTRLDESFFLFLENVLYDDPYIYVANYEGKPRVFVENRQNYFETNLTPLVIAGLWRIENERLKDAAMKFVRIFIQNNQFCPFYQTVWDTLFKEAQEADVESAVSDADEIEPVKAIIEDSKSILCEDEALEYKIKELKGYPLLSRDELAQTLEKCTTKNEKEEKLLDLLKSNIRFAYECAWEADDSSPYDCYASVCICNEDYFPIMLKKYDIMEMGYSLIGALYDGDCYSQEPITTRVLLPDGSLYDLYEKEGFALFTDQLNKILETF